MLQRIYGTAFFDKKALDAHLAQAMEEAKKRDHRKLGPALGLFAFHEYAPGAAFWLPNGTTLYNVLGDAMRRLVRKNGYQEVKTPLLFNKRLWETSRPLGQVPREHVPRGGQRDRRDAAARGALHAVAQAHELPVAPPASTGCSKRSYRELPIRYYTTDVLHRNEASGSLGGLTRVRQFEQDDSHIYLMESQIVDEVRALVRLMTARLRRLRARSSPPSSPRARRRPHRRRRHSGTGPRRRSRARSRRSGLPCELKPGDGAFYGPKIDFDVTDSLGRKWQLCTIQLDYAAPERFDLTYVGRRQRRAPAGGDPPGHLRLLRALHRHPHRALRRRLPDLAGAGAGPGGHGLRPVQRLGGARWRRGSTPRASASSSTTPPTSSAPRSATPQLAKIPFTLVVGEKEVEAQGVSPRRHGGEDLKTMPLEAFVELLAQGRRRRRTDGGRRVAGAERSACRALDTAAAAIH